MHLREMLGWKAPSGPRTRNVSPRPARGAPTQHSLRMVRRLLRIGTAALCTPEAANRYGLAERCFRRALQILQDVVGTAHPMVAQVTSQIAGACDRQHKCEEAETFHLRGLAIQQALRWPPTVCDHVALLSLAAHYGRRGKLDLREAVLERVRQSATCSCRRGNGADDAQEDAT